MLISTLFSFLFLVPSPVLAPAEYVNQTLKRICSCESTGNPDNEPIQFNEDGNVLQGKRHPADHGACQINLDVWYEKSVALNYDVDTTDGNIRMANYIWSIRGTRDWNASRSCWAKK